MKININGITREMTAEEIAEFERMAAEIEEAQAQSEATEIAYLDDLLKRYGKGV